MAMPSLMASTVVSLAPSHTSIVHKIRTWLLRDEARMFHVGYVAICGVVR